MLNLWDKNVAVNESGFMNFFPVPREWGPRRMARMGSIEKQNMSVLGQQTVGKEASVRCKTSELTFGRVELQVMVG